MNEEIIDLLKIKIEKARRELPEDTQNAISAVDWKMVILGMRAKKGYTFEQLGDLEIETELLLSGLLTPENYPKELEKRMGISKREADELVNDMNQLVFKKIREELVKNTERKKIFAGKTVSPMPNVFDRADWTKIKIPINQTAQTISLKAPPRDMAEEKAQLRKDGIEIIDKPVRSLDQPEADVKEEIPMVPVENIQASKMETLPIPEKLELETSEKPREETPAILAQKLSGTFQVPLARTDHSLENISKTSPSSYPSRADPYRLDPEK